MLKGSRIMLIRTSYLSISACFAFIFCMPLAAQATPASFDCSNAHSLIETTICRDTKQDLGSLDLKMSEEFKAAIDRAPSDKSNLIAEQQHWLRERNTSCSGDVQAQTATCLAEAYKRRIAQLTASPSSCKKMVQHIRPIIESALLTPVAS